MRALGADLIDDAAAHIGGSIGRREKLGITKMTHLKKKKSERGKEGDNEYVSFEKDLAFLCVVAVRLRPRVCVCVLLL